MFLWAEAGWEDAACVHRGRKRKVGNRTLGDQSLELGPALRAQELGA
jgi:hypothetical protein